MKIFRKITFLISMLILINPFQGQSQDKKSPTYSEEKLKEAARDIMANATSCALITIDSEGIPRVRAMDPFPVEKDFTVWFGTNINSRKVAQIKNDSRVTLYYIDPDLSGYITIQGKAEVIDEEAAERKWWKEVWKSFYPDKRESYCLIKFSPEWIEVLSTKFGISNNPKTWQPPRLKFD